MIDLKLIKRGDTLLTCNEGKYRNFISNRIERSQIKAGFSLHDAKYTHIEVIGPPPISIVAAPPRVREANFLKRYKGRYVIITRFRGYENDMQGADVAFWAATTANERYDYPGVLNFIIGWIKQKASWWFCAENWVYSTRKVLPTAFIALVIKASKAMPAQGLNDKHMVKIWEGYL